MKKIELVNKMPFEEAIAELEIVVQGLETGNVQLETAIETYEYANALKIRCEALLKNAKLKVEEIYQGKDNKLAIKDSNLEDMFST